MTNSEFRELATLYLEDAIDADGLEQLNRELANSPERVREFNDLRLLLGALPELTREADVALEKRPDRSPRLVLRILAAAACFVVGISLWFNQPPGVTPGENPTHYASALTITKLAPGWMCESRGARFTKLAPGRVRLDQGELHVKSAAVGPGEDARSPLSIETQAGIATAKGTEFYIGNHQKNKQKGNKMNAMHATRVLVLSGIVTLTNQFGAVAGEANDLLVADPDSAPVKETVKANSQFAVDLYKQVSRENEGKNIFFSPYSISSALAMTAEGARGETAAEMADVLHFPAVAKRVGESAQLIPWRSSLIHTGFEQLNSVLDRAANDPTVIEKRERLTALRTKLAEAKVVTQKAKEWQAHRSCVDAENKLVAQINELAAQIDPFELNIANAIWAEKTFSIEAPYRETVGKHYGTGAFRAADFKGNADGERDKINSWVEGKTKDRIKDLIGKGVLTDTTRMVLVNAIYFKGEWASPFKEANTKDADFTTADGTKTTTPTMHGGSGDASYAAFNADGTLFATPDRVPIRGNDPGPARYPDAGGFAMAKLPYKGDEISMVLIAPMAHDGLNAIEEKLSSAKLDEWVGKLKQRQTQIVLPTFKLETEYALGEGGTDPKGILPAMGMKRAFTDPRLENSADFSGMHVPASPMDALYIGKVIHKAFLEVNEKGTEAAAATAVAMSSPASLPRTEPFNPVFKADKPFLMLIRHDATGAILFMGRMMTPPEDGGD
jgi:serpin B